MDRNKKIFEELYKGNRSFSVISSVLAYFKNPQELAKTKAVHEEKWNAVLSDPLVPQIELPHILYKLKYQILLEKTQRQRHLMIRIGQAAAILLLPLVLFFVFRYNQHTPEITQQQSLMELHCPEGARTKFTLPDGSTGWLAGGSVLTYSSDFEKDRSLSVEGEAFFSVVHDKSRPFKVRLGKLNVKVLGTKFNVLNYPDDPSSEVVVLSGLVEVTGTEKKFKEKLTSDKMLKLQKEKNRIYLSNINAESYTAWIEGRLEFNNEHLESVCRKIERFYDVDVDLNMKGLEDNVFRANVQIGSLEELLKYMSLALPIKYELIDAEKTSTGKITRRQLIIEKLDRN